MQDIEVLHVVTQSLRTADDVLPQVDKLYPAKVGFHLSAHVILVRDGLVWFRMIESSWQGSTTRRKCYSTADFWSVFG
jgi:hypothetical protein